MGKYSKIDWCDHTWNPWQGCKKVSAGCENCYMFRDKKRYGQNPNVVVRSKSPTFNKPLKWKGPAKVFVCSWSDFFIKNADAWRKDAWGIIRECPHLTFQLLTKRPERMKACMPDDWGSGWDNVWIGITLEDEESADKRIPVLLDFPSKIKFVSAEPLLEPINFYHSLLGIDWVIAGGESGYGNRHMHPDWARDIRNQCTEYNTPFFMKQMSGNTKEKRRAIPDDLMIREFPND